MQRYHFISILYYARKETIIIRDIITKNLHDIYVLFRLINELFHYMAFKELILFLEIDIYHVIYILCTL